MLARIRLYLKAYFITRHEELTRMAVYSAREYFNDTEFTAKEFTTYQRGYIAGYRAVYAKAMLEQYSSATLNVASRLTPHKKL